MTEAVKQNKKINWHSKQELKILNMEMPQKVQNERRVASEGRERSQDVHAGKIVTLLFTPERAMASQAPNPRNNNKSGRSMITSNRIACPQRPYLAVDSDREIVGAFRGLARSESNRRRPR
jgi:hypothetical protein